MYSNIDNLKKILSLNQSIIGLINLKKNIEENLYSFVPNVFWDRKEHKVSLPYIAGFNEINILIKVISIQMNHELLEYSKQEINDLLDKCLIRENMI